MSQSSLVFYEACCIADIGQPKYNFWNVWPRFPGYTIEYFSKKSQWKCQKTHTCIIFCFVFICIFYYILKYIHADIMYSFGRWLEYTSILNLKTIVPVKIKGLLRSQPSQDVKKIEQFLNNSPSSSCLNKDYQNYCTLAYSVMLHLCHFTLKSWNMLKVPIIQSTVKYKRNILFKKDFSGIPFILWAIKPDSEAPRMQQTSATSMTNKD